MSRWGLRKIHSVGILVDRHCGSAQLLVRSTGSLFVFHRTQSRIGSPVSTPPPPTPPPPSHTVQSYPASNGQLNSSALPGGNRHEQSTSRPLRVSQEQTMSARGKASRVATLLEVFVWVS